METSLEVAHYHGIECLPKRVRFVRADLDESQTTSVLKIVPTMTWLLAAAAMVAALGFARLMSRKDFIEMVTDEPDEDDPGSSRDFFVRQMKHLDTYVLDARDVFLQQTLLREVLKSRGNGEIIGICYGAAHMLKVHEFLVYELGYRKADVREVLAFAGRVNHIGTPEDGFGFAKRAFRKLVNIEFKPMESSLLQRFTGKRRSNPYKLPRVQITNQAHFDNFSHHRWVQSIDAGFDSSGFGEPL